MTIIKAPFNFVPVSNTVFTPDWADQISQDIPFEDGMSGTIELKITAKTPIFIKTGQRRDQKEEDNSFSNVNGEYFIPGTSLKGSIRSVLEIMSFGKMNHVDDDTFGVRDLGKTGEKYRSNIKNSNCGWLQYKNGAYMLTDCEEPGRISLKDIDEKFNTQLFSFVIYEPNFKNEENRTAKAKYDIVKKKINNENLMTGFFEKDEELTEKMTEANPVDTRFFVKFGGREKGTLVFTGQPGARKYNPNPRRGGKCTGKFYEFVFLDREKQPQEIDEKIIKAFRSVHRDSPDFKNYWGPKLNQGEQIPVFFHKDSDGQLRNLGLSYMYKYPYAKSVCSAIPASHLKNQNKCDLAECIFGFSEKNNSLKGRVQFSPLFSKNATPADDITMLLGSPKASYYPIYIRQKGTNGKTEKYETYDDGIISGWKRYMVRKVAWSDKTGNPKLDSVIKPIQKEAVFTGKIRFHNLRRVELGALLSALTFHSNFDCFHQIGQGKPYGFGKVKIEAKLIGSSEDEQIKLMAEFEKEMNKTVKKWNESDQIKELFTLSSIEIGLIDRDFKYMHMENERSKNDFVNAKNENEYLQKYTELLEKDKNPFIPQSLIEN